VRRRCIILSDPFETYRGNVMASTNWMEVFIFLATVGGVVVVGYLVLIALARNNLRRR